MTVAGAQGLPICASIQSMDICAVTRGSTNPILLPNEAPALANKSAPGVLSILCLNLNQRIWG